MQNKITVTCFKRNIYSEEMLCASLTYKGLLRFGKTVPETCQNIFFSAFYLETELKHFLQQRELASRKSIYTQIQNISTCTNWRIICIDTKAYIYIYEMFSKFPSLVFCPNLLWVAPILIWENKRKFQNASQLLKVQNLKVQRRTYISTQLYTYQRKRGPNHCIL